MKSRYSLALAAVCILATCAGAPPLNAANLPTEPFAPPNQAVFRVLVGDMDDFHAGDAADIPLTSPACADIIAYCEKTPGQGTHVILDVAGDNRPVGMSFFLPVMRIPAAVRDAVVEFRFHAVSRGARNDAILVAPNDNVLIALRDVLGFEPVAGRTYQARINLRNVPVRLSGSPAPDDRWRGGPDAWRDFVPEMEANTCLDFVFSDDVMIDWAELVLRYSGSSPPADGDTQVPLLLAPNPAGGDGDLTITFALPSPVTAAVDVLDVTGRRIAVPAEAVFGPGVQRVIWNRRGLDGARLQSGVYFVRVSTPAGVSTAKLILLDR